MVSRRYLWVVLPLLAIFITGCISQESPAPVPSPSWPPSAKFNFVMPDKLPDATLGNPYPGYSFCQPTPKSKLLCGELVSEQLTNPTGGVQPYTFQRGTLSEFLPWGMTLQPSGILEGTPDPAKAEPRIYELEICAIDNTRSSVCKKTFLRVKEAGRATVPPVQPSPKAGVGKFDGDYDIVWTYCPESKQQRGNDLIEVKGNRAFIPSRESYFKGQYEERGEVISPEGTVHLTKTTTGDYPRRWEFVAKFSLDPSIPGGAMVEGFYSHENLEWKYGKYSICKDTFTGKRRKL